MPLFHGAGDSIYVLGEVRLYLFLLFFYLDNTNLFFYSAPEKGIIMNLLSLFRKIYSSHFYGLL